MRRKKTDDILRGKLNLTMHPEVREWADLIAFKRRRSLSQLFEDLVEAEWKRQNQPQPPAVPAQPATPVQPVAPAQYSQPMPILQQAMPYYAVQPMPLPQQQATYNAPQGY